MNNKNGLGFERDLENSMKEENDVMIDHIYSTVRNIKQQTLSMTHKIQISNQECNEMDKKYSQTGSLMDITMKQLGQVFSNNSNYWCYLVIFIVVLIYLLYKIAH